jgi:hypothetical protein
MGFPRALSHRTALIHADVKTAESSGNPSKRLFFDPRFYDTKESREIFERSHDA